eukprot:6475434-Amphidinium_carterae.1
MYTNTVQDTAKVFEPIKDKKPLVERFCVPECAMKELANKEKIEMLSTIGKKMWCHAPVVFIHVDSFGVQVRTVCGAICAQAAVKYAS